MAINVSATAIRAAALLAVAAATLAACSGQPVQCTAGDAQQPVVDIVKEELEQLVAKELRSDGGGPSLSKIRAAIAQLNITLEDIRTSKVDPNSTKRFCAGSLSIRFPADVIADADNARRTAGMNSVSDMADSADVDRRADRFSTDIEFNVQPTDDGSKIFAETESGNNMFGFAAALLSSSLMRAAVEQSQRDTQQAADQASAEQNAALAEQRNANLASVRTENQLAAQSVAAVWRAIPSATRNRLLPLQRAWIRKKQADCNVEAASSSTDATEREAARLACDTRVTNERIGYLNEFRGEEPSAAEPADTPEDMMGNGFE